MSERGANPTLRPVYTKPAKFIRELAWGYIVAGIIVGLGSAATEISWALEAPVEQARWQVSVSRAPLSDALTQLAKQISLQIVRYSDVESGKIVVGPTYGVYTREEALDLLLLGTGLTYRYVNDHTVAIIRLSDPGTQSPNAPKLQPTLPVPEPSSSNNAGNEENHGSTSVKSITDTPKHRSLWSRIFSLFAGRAEEPSPSSSPPSRGARAVALCSFMAAAAGVCAQQVGSATHQAGENASILEEIIVTASKREESLSKAPIAISVLSQEQLQAAGVQSVEDLPSAIPNVQVAPFPILGSVRVTIRGISAMDFADYAEPSVATYEDGTYVPRAHGLGGAFYDLARVEVLRGPQGTLYGRNATAGSINIVTADPEQTFDAATDLSAGNYGDVRAHGMVNIPLSDTLSIRGAIMYHRNDGYFDTRGTTARNYGVDDERAARLTALWRPSDVFKWRLVVDDYVQAGTQGQGVDTASDGQPSTHLPVLDRPVQSTPEPREYINDLGIRSRMDWQFTDKLSLAYIAGFRKNIFDYQTLWDGETNPIAASLGTTSFKSIYQEVDLTANGERWTNILGGAYDNFSDRPIVNNPVYDPLFTTIAGDWPIIKAISWGIFDQATFSLTKRLRLIGGIRDSHDSKAYAEHLVLCAQDRLYTGFPLAAGCAEAAFIDLSHKWSRVTWKTGLEYDFSDKTLGYLTVATGFKSGGFNGTPDPTLRNYNPEDVTNYELGIKSRFLDDRASLNAAVFYMDYKNIQVSQNRALSIVTVNAAASAIYGVELEGSWRITPKDRLDAFGTVLHATFTNYENAIDTLTNAVVPSLDGKHLPNAPDFSGRVQYAHDFSLPNGGSLSPSAAVYWQSVSYLRELNNPIDRVPAYSKTILRLTYQDPTHHWNAEGYVDNLENKLVRIAPDTLLGRYISYYSQPRTYGVRLSYRY